MDNAQQKIKEKIISLIPEQDVQRSNFLQQIDLIGSGSNSDIFYASLLSLFVHSSFKEDDAKKHWENIFSHYDFFLNKVKYNAGLRVVIFDYFTNLNPIISSPIIVEIHVFKETEKMAMVDSLTGIFNRRYFDINLKKELKRARRYDKDFSLIMIDLDNFKNINDTHGHVFGDKVLRKFATLLTNMSREEDIICRYGGEEFMVILPETAGNGALVFGERIRAGLKSDKFFKEYSITVSGGISSYPHGWKTVEELVENVDKALYEAKFSGKDCFIINTVENRRRKRYKKTWQITYQLIDPTLGQDDKQGETLTQDISIGGARIEISQKYELDAKLIITISLPNRERVVTVGKIVWAKKLKDDLYIYGLRFIDLKKEQLEGIRNFLPVE